MVLAAFVPTFDNAWAAFWFYANCVIGLIWLRRHIDLARGRREPTLQADQPGPPAADLPPLSMLVAAKDEETNIGRCVEGLLRQDYPQLQIIAVNDRSGDRTGPIIDALATGDDRLAAVHVRSLPPGWFGKNNAMRAGVERASGQWLCFSDADCAYDSPHLLAAAVRLALVEKIDFLSVLPRLEASSLWERIVQPVAGGIMVFWFPPQKVNDPRSPCAYANGAFMLLSRAAYDRLGGHEPVRLTLNEDMHLARRAKELGLRLRVIRGGDLYRVRMYSGFRQIWRGWSRIFYGCFGTLPRLLASIGMLTVFSIAPYATLALSGLAGPQWPWLAGAAGFAIAAQQSVLWGFYRLTGNSPALALTYPVGAVICLGMTFNAIGRLFGIQTTWRGTAYRGGARTSAESPAAH